MAHDSNFTRTYRNSPYGISMGEIKQVLGESTLDLGSLCTSSHINKYAKYRPVKHTSKGILTDAMRKEVNCGIDCSDSSTGCFSTSLKNLLDRAKTVNDWTVILPDTPQDNYRMLDFDKYYQNARAPFQQTSNVVGNVTSTTSQEQIWQSIPVIAQIDTYNGYQENLRPSDLLEALTRKGNTTSEFQFGYLYRNSATPSVTPSIAQATSVGQTIDNFVGYSQPVQFTPPASYASPVTYDVAFIAYVQNGGTYWATFFPKTYCQLKLSLFGVFDENDNSIEGTTLNFNSTGGTRQLKISGYNWDSSWGGKGNPDAPILISMSPDHGGTISNWSEVTFTVGNANISTFSGYYTTTVRITAPSTIDTNPNYYIDFHVRQQCGQKYHSISHTDSSGNELGNEIRLTNNSISAEKDFYISADVAWNITSIVYVDGEGEEHTTSDISVTPTSALAPASGQSYRITTCTIANEVALPAGRHYKVSFYNSQYDVLYRLNIVAKE